MFVYSFEIKASMSLVKQNHLAKDSMDYNSNPSDRQEMI